MQRRTVETKVNKENSEHAAGRSTKFTLTGGAKPLSTSSSKFIPGTGNFMNFLLF